MKLSDDTILKLRRRYSKDEEMAVLIEKVAELQGKVERQAKALAERDEYIMAVIHAEKPEEFFLERDKRIKKLEGLNKALITKLNHSSDKDVTEWRNKYFMLKALYNSKQ